MPTKTKPIVSVIITCYNLGRYLNEAVDSLLAQTFKDLEIIIFNDGSTDEYTNNLLKNYKKSKTKVIQSENRGLTAARNLAIEHSHGKYILPLDADDKIKPRFLEKTVAILDKDPKVGFVTTWVQTFGLESRIWKTEKFDLIKSLSENITAVSSLFRKKCWEESGGYKEIFSFQDWDFWISIAQQGWKGELIKEPLFLYRIREDSMFQNSLQKKKRLELVGQIINSHSGLYRKYFKEVILKKEESIINHQEEMDGLRAIIAEKDRYLKEIYNSTSWRLTKPVRSMGEWLGRGVIKPQHVIGLKKYVPRPLKSVLKRIYNKRFVQEKSYPEKRVSIEKWSENKPLISIIIPCYNYGQYVEEAIDSVLTSTFQDFEILVVNDGSTDEETNQILKNLKKPKTRIIHQQNQGLAQTRNNGIEKAKGKYILCLDADDLVEPDYIEKGLEVLESRPEIGFVYSLVRLFGDVNEIWETEQYDFGRLLRYNFVSVSSIFRREAWHKVGGYNPNMFYGYEDWDFWISVSEAGWRGNLVSEVLFNHRKHGHTMTKDAHNKYNYLVKQLQENHKELYKTKKSRQIEKDYFDTIVENYPLSTIRQEQFFQTKKKNILILMPYLDVGGAESVIYDLIKGLKDEVTFHIITTVAFTNPWHEKFKQLTPNIYHLPNFLKERYWKKYVLNYIQAKKIKTILVSASEFGYQISPDVKAKYPKIKLVNLLHNDSELGFISQVKKYDNYFEIHIGVNSKIKDCLVRKYKIPNRKVKVIYNAVDTDKFNPEIYRETNILSDLGLPENKKIVAWIGRFSEEKNPFAFIEIAKKMHKEKDYFFVMAGTGPMEKNVKRSTRKIKNLKYIGYLERVPELLSKIYCLILTSKIEGLPITLLEAQAMGVPVISTNVGEVSQVLKNGKNGFIINNLSTIQFTRKIKKIKQLEQKLIRENIKKNFALENALKNYEKVL